MCSMCSISALLLTWTTMTGFPSSASFFMCFALCGTCVPFQHHYLHKQQWQDFHLQLLSWCVLHYVHVFHFRTAACSYHFEVLHICS
jgi:phosphate/sulfate permease